MKKLFVILLLFAYGFTVLGIRVNMHYCMNEFVGSSIDFTDDDECNKCGMPETDNSGCCKDESVLVKLNDSHKISIIDTDFSNSFFEAIPSTSYHLPQHIQFTTTACNTWPQSHAPPDIGSLALYVRNCVFLI